MCTPPSELALAEAFVRGDFEIDGNLEAAVAIGEAVPARLGSLRALAHIASVAALLPRDDAASLDRLVARTDRHGTRHSPTRDLTAVRAHYDLGNDFYAQWLDRSLTYSCAYFETGNEDIDTAQAQKLDLVCRKLRLAPRERLLDVGSGWGSLIRHAAQAYGVDAYGITLSAPQAQWAEDRIRADGLESRAHVAVADYRSPHPAAPFDKIVTIGMIEHVGEHNLGVFFERLFELLRPGGIALIHGITAEPTPRRNRTLWRKGSFIDRYIFPDGELTPLGVRIDAAEAAGFEVRDVETLREHYVLTLRHWVRRLEGARGVVEPMVGSATYRAWRLYMAASAQGFASGRLGVSQLVIGKRGANGRLPAPYRFR
jgi:cyclopropane-fatty-acyl-phospholipid synthase